MKYEKELEKILDIIKSSEPNKDLLKLFSRTGRELLYKSLTNDNRNVTYLADEDLDNKIMETWCIIFYSTTLSKINRIKTKQQALEYWINEVAYNQTSASNILKEQGAEVVDRLYKICMPNNQDSKYTHTDKIKCINTLCDRLLRKEEVDKYE